MTRCYLLILVIHRGLITKLVAKINLVSACENKLMELCFKYIERQFSHTRFLFLLIIVLNTLDTNEHIGRLPNTCVNNFTSDLNFCHNCFKHQIQHCLNFFEQIKDDRELSLRQLLTFFPLLSSNKRNHQSIRLKNSNEKLLTKYLFNQNGKQVRNNSAKYLLKREFLQQQDAMQGIQYAPVETVEKFIQEMQLFHTDLSDIAVWYYLLTNIQPLLLPVLYKHNFPVPKTYALCGFTVYQEYAGRDLFSFFQTDIFTKLEISKQLLNAALKFSHGFNRYRLYITDFTADNIVYNAAVKQISFVDLDTIFIVDSSRAKYKSSIHKHRYVECNGCFGYSADEVASYNISDINIYLTCQFLREDLYKDQSKGFLYPLPKELTTGNSKLRLLLNECVDCPDDECWERFTPAEQLIAEIENILYGTTLSATTFEMA